MQTLLPPHFLSLAFTHTNTHTHTHTHTHKHLTRKTRKENAQRRHAMLRFFLSILGVKLISVNCIMPSSPKTQICIKCYPSVIGLWLFSKKCTENKQKSVFLCYEKENMLTKGKVQNAASPKKMAGKRIYLVWNKS
jgi:hypothetical protein